MSLTFKSKVKLFTHLDLDGIGSEVVGRLAFPLIDVTIVRNPKDASEKVKEFLDNQEYLEYDHIFITDISVSDEVAMEINELGLYETMKFTLLDHHGTADYLNKYPWAHVIEKSPIGKEAGTHLFFKHLTNNGFFKHEIYRDGLEVFVEKVRRYDCWEWKDKYNDLEALDLNTLFFLIGRDKFVNQFLNKFLGLDICIVREGSWKDMFDDTDKMVIKIENDKKESYINKKEKQMFQTKLLGLPVGVVFAEQYTSELGNVLAERNGKLAYIVIIDIGNSKVSYRTTRNDINLGKDVAGKFGGGGHPKASGSEFSTSIPKLAFNLIFNIGFTSKLVKLFDKTGK